MHAATSRHHGESECPFQCEPQDGLSGDVWPVHPHRLDDELLSSWLLRLAHANGLKLQTFLTLAVGRQAAVLNRDIDRSASTELLKELSRQTGASFEELKGGLLSSYEGTLYEAHNLIGTTSWLLPLGIYHRLRHAYGVQFCSQCLCQDSVPYYRRRWRLAFVTICDRHRIMLHDRCPGCGAPVVIFRNDVGRRKGYKLGVHTVCWQCNFDLRYAASQEVGGEESLTSLRTLVTAFQLGWWFQGGRPISYGHLYFAGLRHLITVLCSGRGERLRAYVGNKTGESLPQTHRGPENAFERRSIDERHQLLLAALWLLQDWPNRFVKAAQAAQVSYAAIMKDKQQLPFWFESVIRTHLDNAYAPTTEEEARLAARYVTNAGLPLSRKAVAGVLGRLSQQAERYKKPLPRRPGDEQYTLMIERLDMEMRGTYARSAQRLVLERDRAMLRLMQATGWGLAKISRLTVADAVRISKAPRETREFPACVSSILLSYLRDVRRYLEGGNVSPQLFIGWRHGGLGAKDLRLRIKRLEMDDVPP